MRCYICKSQNSNHIHFTYSKMNVQAAPLKKKKNSSTYNNKRTNNAPFSWSVPENRVDIRQYNQEGPLFIPSKKDTFFLLELASFAG